MNPPTTQPTPTPPSPPSGPMTRARAKAIHDKVSSFLSMCDIDPTLDGTLPHANALCILRYAPHGGRQVDTEEDGEGQREDRERAGRTGQPASQPELSRRTGPQTGAPKLQPNARQNAFSARNRTEPAPAGRTGPRPEPTGSQTGPADFPPKPPVCALFWV